MTEAQALECVRCVFRDALAIQAPAEDQDIIDSGVLDSLALVTLLFEIEQAASVEIAFDSIELADVRTVGGIARMLVRAAG